MPFYALISILCYAGAMALRIPAENAALAPGQDEMLASAARPHANSETA